MAVFKKIRFCFRFVSAFWQAHKKTILFAFLIGAFIAGLFPRVINLLTAKRVARIGFTGKFTLETLPQEVLEKIGQGLTQINRDGSVSPALASGWQINDDGRIYQFTLKDNLFWHDGIPLTTKDISYNFTDVSVKKINEKTIEFQLKEPFSPFPAVLSQPLFCCGLVGSGDWQVKSAKRNGQIIESLVLDHKKGPGQKIIYKFYPTESTLKTAYKLGEIDIAKDLIDPQDFREWPNVKIEEEINNNQFAVIIFNTQDGILAEKPIRQALAYGLKKPWPKRALGPINPDSWAYNPNLKKYDYDQEKARELLEKGLGESEEIFKLELTTFSDLFGLAEEIADDWQQMGIETNIQVTSVIPRDYQALLVIEDIPPDPDQYLLWHSTQPSNLSRFSSPQIDKLLEDGRTTMNQEERREIYLDFQRFLVEDVPIIFLYHPTVYTISRNSRN